MLLARNKGGGQNSIFIEKTPAKATEIQQWCSGKWKIARTYVW